jgi:hypothetical protein
MKKEADMYSNSKYYVSLIGIVMFLTNLFAQAPDIEWSKTYGDIDHDKGYSVKLTDNGYIISGYKSTGWWHDYYLVKTDLSGDSIWTRTYCAQGQEFTHEFGYDVQQTSDKGYIICGYTLNGFDIYIVKTDTLGEIVWTKFYGEPSSDDIGWHIEKTSDSGYVVIGCRLLSGRPYDYNVWLLKLDAEGDTIWTKTFGGTENGEYGKTIQQTSDGYFITAHITNGSDYYAVYLIKTDFQGNVLWTTIHNENYYVEAMYGRPTSDKGYIVTGRCESFYGPGGWYDIYLAKFDSLGNHLWTKKHGTGQPFDSECGNSIQQTADNGYIIAGTWFNSYEHDIYLVRTDSEGDVL